MSTWSVEPATARDAAADACTRLDHLPAADALWRGRLEVWSADTAVQRTIGHRLGWLRALDAVEPAFDRVRGLAAAVRDEGYTRVVLMGMGGSSLAPEVLRQVLGPRAGAPRFVMTDTVNPDAVRDVFGKADRTLYLIASKSGTTIEPSCLAAEARRVAGSRWGADTVAITDPETALHREAQREGFREVFVNPPDIGGRFSALSLFGLVPAALMGADLDALTAAARTMEDQCRRAAAAQNPGLALGAFIASAAAAGRDKLTLLLPPRFAAFGLWVEQLVAESTGKAGVGVLPVTGEPENAHFGDDRAFVAVTFCGEPPSAETVARARATGAPLIQWLVDTPEDVAGEFFRWEMATAACGLLLGVNPFDEPNVQQAKDATRALLEAFKADGRLPRTAPADTRDGVELRLSSALGSMNGAPWAALTEACAAGDYLAILAYAPPDDAAIAATLSQLRTELSAATRVPTTLGYGPRYLHSTGQLHKGGPNTGVFLVITTDPRQDIAVPGEAFTFGVLEAAQALGDFQSLDRTGRRAVHVHVPAGRFDAVAPLLRR